MSADSQPQLRRPGRADHVRNRERILAAARELLAESSIDDLQLEDVAAAAGVGRATLFRHIGGKDALIAEVYRGRMEDLRDLAARCLKIEDPWEGFEQLLRVVAVWLHEDRGLYDFTSRLMSQGATAPDGAVEELVPDLERVFARARAAGEIDANFEVRDIVPLLAFTAWSGQDRQAWLVEVVLRGVRLSGPQ